MNIDIDHVVSCLLKGKTSDLLPLHAERLAGGHHNVNYLLQSEDETCVLRFYPESDSCDLIAHEYNRLQQVYPLGPKPYKLSYSTSLSHSVMLIEYVPGVHKNYETMTQQEIEQLSDLFAKLHSRIAPSFQVYPSNPHREGTYAQYARAVGNFWVATPLVSIDMSYYPDAKTLIETGLNHYLKSIEQSKSMKSQAVFSLLHNDPGPENSIWKPDGSIVLIDWTESAYGDPADELAALFTINNTSKLFQEQFLAAYTHHDAIPILQERINIYALRHRLADLVWSMTHLERLRTGKCRTILEKEYEMYTGYYEVRLQALKLSLNHL